MLRPREDDTAETVRKRLEIYRVQTAPLIDYYRRSGRLREIDGVGSFDDVHQALRAALSGAD